MPAIKKVLFIQDLKRPLTIQLGKAEIPTLSFLLMEIFVWNLDAQGAIALFFLPLYLTGLFIFSMFVAVVVTDSRENRSQRS